MEKENIEQVIAKSKKSNYRSVILTSLFVLTVGFSVLNYSDFDYTRAAEAVKDVVKEVVADDTDEIPVVIEQDKSTDKVEKLSTLAPDIKSIENPTKEPVVVPVTVAVDIPIVDPIAEPAEDPVEDKPTTNIGLIGGGVKDPIVDPIDDPIGDPIGEKTEKESITDNKTNTGLIGGGVKKEAEEVVEKTDTATTSGDAVETIHESSQVDEITEEKPTTETETKPTIPETKPPDTDVKKILDEMKAPIGDPIGDPIVDITDKKSTDTGLIGGGVKKEAEEVVEKTTTTTKTAKGTEVDRSETNDEKKNVGDGHVRPDDEQANIKPTNTPANTTDTTTKTDKSEPKTEPTKKLTKEQTAIIEKDTKKIKEGVILAQSADDTDVNSGQIAVKLTTSEIEGKVKGEDITTNEALTALISMTTTEQDIEKVILESISDNEDIKSMEDNAEVEKVLDEIITKKVKDEIIANITKDAVAQGQSVTKETVKKSVNDVIETKGQSKKTINTVIDNTALMSDDAVETSHGASQVNEITEQKPVTEDQKPKIDNTSVKPILKVTAKSASGKKFPIPLENINFKAGSVVMVVEPLRTFTPGLYTLEIEITNPITEKTETFTQDFAWGVLAINTDQDVYKPGQTGELHFGVLDDKGIPTCDAQLSLSIKEPNGPSYTLSTKAGTIQKTKTCRNMKSGSIAPDYKANFKFKKEGTYTLNLSATTANGTRTLTDSVKVTSTPKIIIKRTSATRLYPVGPAPMTVDIEFFEDFYGNITDIAPKDFKITGKELQMKEQIINSSFVTEDTGDSQILTWQYVSAKAGSTLNLKYEYDAPDVSPEFYTVGPLQINSLTSKSSIIEDRVWQIANDAPGDNSPAGISANLALWLRADVGVTSAGGDGTAVSAWQDQWTSGNDAAQAVGGNQPTYRTTGSYTINSNPTVEFDGSTSYMDLPDSTMPDEESYTIFGVAYADTGNNQSYISGGDNSPHITMPLFNGGRFEDHWWGGADQTTADNVLSTNTPFIGNMKYDNTSGHSIFFDGKDITDSNNANRTLTNHDAGTTNGKVGVRPDAVTDFWDGGIAELIVYKQALSAGDQNKVESYLAIKYGITLDQTVATNYVNSAGTTLWDATANSAYTNDVAGIGQDDASGLDQTSSKSINTDAIVTIGSASSQDDGDFLIWGNDNASGTAWTGTDAPSGYQRVAREWHVQETSDVGTVTLTVDVDDSDLDLPSITGPDSNLYIIIDQDGNNDLSDETPVVMYDDGATGGDATASDGIWTINTVDFDTGEEFSFAQQVPNAPGGISTSPGLWLKADGNVYSTGTTPATDTDTIQTWADAGPGGYDATQDTANNRPRFYDGSSSNATNFNPTVRIPIDDLIDSVGNYFNVPGYSPPSGTNSRSIFAVIDGYGGTWLEGAYVLNYGNIWVENGAYSLGVVNGSAGNNYSSVWESSYTVTNDATLMNIQYDGTDDEMFVNGKSEGTNTVTPTAWGDMVIGSMGVGSAPSQVLNANLAELIIYDTDLSANDRAKVNSYLAIKYGFTLDQSTAQNYVSSAGTTIWDATANASYANDIVGIGQDDDSGLDQITSKSENDDGVVSIGSASSQDDGDFLIWGNDNASGTAWTSTGAPSNYVRLAREWHVQETNDVGTVTLTVDLNDSDMNLPDVTALDGKLYIIIDQDGNNDLSDETPVEIYDDGTTGGDATADDGIWTINTVDFDTGEEFSFAQQTPPAPGNISANLQFWVKADGNVYNTGITQALDGETSATWADASGNDNATQSTEGNKPIFNNSSSASAINNNPTLTFDGTDDYLETSNLVPATGTDERSIFTIVSNSNTPNGYHSIVHYGGTNGNESYGLILNSGNPGNHYWFGDYRSSYEMTTNPTLLGITYDGSDDEVFANGKSVGTNTIAINTTSGNNVNIGSRISGPTEVFNGDIAEVIIYNSALSATNRNKVESYLALKYGLTLDQTSATNYVDSAGTVIWNATTNSSYSNDIAGIGQDDDSSLDQTTSMSENSDAIVEVSNASSQDNSDFLIWGNDNDDDGTIAEISSELPTGVATRLDREWKVAETGEIGTVDITFDLTGIVNSGSTAANYRLAIDDDGDFSSGATFVDADSYDDGTKIVTFNGHDFSDGDFFTLGTTAISASIAYSGNFTETSANGGAVETSRVATLTNDTFVNSGSTLTETTHFTLTNKPAGLTAVMTVNGGGTTATLTFTGTATAHADANDVSNLTITFLDGAFTSTSTASDVTGYINNLGTVDFDDQPSIAYSGNFTETSANGGAVETSRVATLTGDTFVNAGSTLTETTHFTLANKPAGLTAVMTVNGGGTTATLTFTGTATAHANANDVSDLTITFLDGAFTNTSTASDATGYTDVSGTVDFADQPSIAYAGNFTEVAANDGSLTGSSRVATLTGDTFVNSGSTLTETTHFTLTNKPAGLTAVMTVNGGGTTATLTFTGNATSHADANDVSNLTIAFLDGTFTNTSAASDVTDYTNTTGTIGFDDPASITYDVATFNEDSANDGSIATTVTATLATDTFVDPITLNTHVQVNNVSTGLTASVSRTAGTTVTITLTGNATAHANANDVSDLEVVWLDGAFTNNASASAVTNYSKTDFAIDFSDQAFVTYSGNFTETSANGGAVETSRVATATGDTFVNSGSTLTENTHFTLTNAPAGLTAVMTVNGGGTTATLTFTGTATAHADSDDVSDLTITFLDGAFTNTSTASDATGYTDVSGTVDFDDQASIIYSGDFTETSANGGAVETSRVATLTGDTFVNAGSTLTETTHFTLTNAPAGLTAVMTVNGGGTTATLTFTGNATAHADANDVSDLTITFLDGAFTTTTTASDVTGYINATGEIDFDDPAVVAASSAVVNTQSGGGYSTEGGVVGPVHQAAKIRSKNDYEPIKKETDSKPQIPKTSFTDIKGHWSESYVQKLGQLDVITGKTAETFDPDGFITRAEITKVMVEAFDVPMVKYPDRPFPDVSIAKWYTYYIQSALVAKIIDGYVDGFFYPENNVTRAEAVKMLLEAANIKIDNQDFLLTYKDVKRAHWFIDYIYTAKSLGLITGYDDNTFKPSQNITRAEVVKLTAEVMDYLKVAQ